YEAGADGRGAQRPLPTASLRALLPTVDLRALPDAGARDRAARAAAASMALRGFDLAQQPPLRSVLFDLGAVDGARAHRLTVIVHHIAFDGWSLGRFVDELAALYDGATDRLPHLPVQYADIAVWQRARGDRQALARRIEPIRQRLAGAPTALTLPTDRPRQMRGDIRRGLRHWQPLTAADSAALRQLAIDCDATPFMIGLAAWALVLGRLAGQREVVIGTPVAGRFRREMEPLIGFFVNNLVLRIDLNADGDGARGSGSSFRALVAHARAVTLEAQGDADVPFAALIEALDPARSLEAAPPLFQVVFAYEDAPRPLPPLGDAQLTRFEARRGPARFDFNLTLHDAPADADAGMRLALIHDRSLFDVSTARRLLQTVQRLLVAAVRDPDADRASLPIFASDGARHQATHAWSGAQTPSVPAAVPVHARIAGQAMRHPERAAIDRGGRRIAYADLELATARFAAVLRTAGVDLESRVALALEPSIEAVLAMLAVWRAGGAWVPIAPTLPRARVAELLADSGASLMLVHHRRTRRARPAIADDEDGGSGVRTIALDGIEVPAGDYAVAHDDIGTQPESAAYVIYTSGSTGKPKGVVVSHGALGFYLDQLMATEIGRLTLPWTTQLSFDAFFKQVFPPLLRGDAVQVPMLDPVDAPLPFLDALADAARAAGRPAALNAAPSLWRVLLDAASQVPASSRPRLDALVLSGEVLPVPLARRTAARFPRVRLWNVYGPTETTANATFDTVPLAPFARVSGDSPPSITIGRPLAGTRVYVVDATLRPLPPGAVGELLIGGAGVARGYEDRPALTARSFVPDPFSGDRPGARIYRSGDRAIWREDGRIALLGRFDHQIKLRGFRIELGEIEAHLEALPTVRAAAARLWGRADSARLVGYLEPLTAAAIEDDADADALAQSARRALEASLPAHQVPAELIVLTRLPKTATGKVDRRALPAPSSTGDAATTAFAPPRTAREALLVRAWQELLTVEDDDAADQAVAPTIGIHDDFFARGGHSLLAVRLALRVGELLGGEVPVRWIFDAPTPARLAERLDAGDWQTAIDAPPIVRADADARRAAPLSFAQERMWFLDALQPGGTAYHMPWHLSLDGPLDDAALRLAVALVMRRHPTLRTVYEPVDGGVRAVQRVVPFDAAIRSALPTVDLHALDEVAVASTLDALWRAASRQPIDLAAGPVARWWLVRCAPARHALFFVVHHIAFDGASFEVLRRDLSAYYAAVVEALAEGAAARTVARRAARPAFDVDYVDHALWQRAWLQGEVLEAEIAHWRGRVGDLDVLELPTDRPRRAHPHPPAGRLRVDLGVPLDALRALGAAHGATPFVTAAALYRLLLGRLTDPAGRIAIGTPVAGREHAVVRALVGLFVNTVALRIDLPGDDASVGDLVERARAVTTEALAHQELPLEKLVEALRIARDAEQPPLVQTLFALSVDEAPSIALSGVEVAIATAEPDQAKFDLTTALGVEQGRLFGVFQYRADLFDPTTIARWATALRSLLRAAIDAPEQPIGALRGLTAPMRRMVEAEWPRPSGAAHMQPVTIDSLFAAIVRRQPLAPALRFEDDDGLAQILTYGTLAKRVARLAGHLRARGVRAEDRVELALPRQVARIVAMLAVQRLGAAYVPIDPADPASRRSWLRGAADIGARVVTLDDADASSSTLPTIRVDAYGFPVGPDGASPDGAHEPAPVEPGLAWPVPESALYVLFTSGSTGVPKGVVVHHRNVVRMLVAVHPLERGPDVVYLHAASPAFDASTYEFWTPLLSGGQLAILPPGPVGVAELRRTIARNGVTSLVLPTSLFHQVVDLEPSVFAPVQHLAIGGDVLSASHVRRVRRVAPHLTVSNGYGPTEATVFVTMHRLGPGRRQREGALPIGRPRPGAFTYVLDDALRPLLPGVVGELWVGGEGVARGYRQRPAQTADRFRPDAYAPASAPGGRMYGTGDRVRWLPDGTLGFLGRSDQQVKLRGFRIEPGEVTAALLQLPAVGEALVVLHRSEDDGSADGGKRLIAYITEARGTRADEPRALDRAAFGQAIREQLAARLPGPMVPSTVVVLDDMPRGATGKIDPAKLPPPSTAPAPDADAVDDDAAPAEVRVVDAPRDALEEAVVALYARLLADAPDAPETVGVHDDFFMLGGHSLLAIELAVALRPLAQREVSVRQIFDAPTPATLATALRGHALDAPAATSADAAPRDDAALDAAQAETDRHDARADAAPQGDIAAIDPSSADADAADDADGSDAADDAALDEPALTPVARADGNAHPLSFAQERLWFLDRFAPGGDAYSMPWHLDFEGALDRLALADALTALVRRHEGLRTTFPADDGQPYQQIAPAASARMPLPCVDLRGLTTERAAASIDRLTRRFAVRAFDLARGPLMRALLVRRGSRHHRLLVNLHHIVFDGWSVGVLTRELRVLYAALRDGSVDAAARARAIEAALTRLPTLTIQPLDAAVWQRTWLAGARLTRDIDHWRTALGPMHALRLPFDRPQRGGADEAASARAGQADFQVSEAVSRAVDALARARGLTPFVVLMATWQAVLARWTGQRDFAVGTPVAGRDRAELMGLIGLFVNTLALRADLADDPTFDALLTRTRAVALDAFAHQDVPFEKLVDALQPARQLDVAPIFQVMFSLQTAGDDAALALPGVRLADVGASRLESAKFDLSLTLRREDAGYRGRLVYRTDRFTAATMMRLASAVQTLVAAAVTAPSTRLSMLPLLTPEMRRTLLAMGETGLARDPGRDDGSLSAR
ncbi:MAG: amino acid adenylation domain-containing protein, partial [Acidobacteriota bacterium]